MAGVPTRLIGGKKMSALGIIGILLLAVVVGAGIKFGGQVIDYVTLKATGGKASSVGDLAITEEQQKEAEKPLIIDTRSGVSSTVYLNAYDREANSETSANPIYWVFNSKGSKLVNGAYAASVATTKGEVLTFYIGNSSFYGEVYPVYDVVDEAPTVSFDVHAVAAESSLTTIPYDSDMTVLTADDNTNNTADYMYAMGADAEKILNFKVTNAQADKEYDLCAVCTFATDDVDEFEVVDSRFEAVGIPKEERIASITITEDDQVGTTTQTGYENCYFAKNVIKLHEWDEAVIKTKVTASSTDPTANTDDFVALQTFDCGYRDGKDGKVNYDFFRHDDNGRTSEVGMVEDETSPFGAKSGAVVEIQ